MQISPDQPSVKLLKRQDLAAISSSSVYSRRRVVRLAVQASRRHNSAGRGDKGNGVRQGLTDEDEAAMIAELARLRQDHRDLDAAISALEEVGTPDRLQLQRLKKRKLGLKDRISFLEDRLTPDIIA